ncbi:hypothetical protein CTAYLR_004252 [Chrysophaeum taylorii]|uniref:SNF2 N-terminal domain-containing protein n=1 Tax=Chrysophaeum taylorii TaxID=2483200 RepID=A0AAD7UCJ5_9STRA|nr:hypothetical protein CTAYLR_004252 [Chrysophaeum taylorii]
MTTTVGATTTTGGEGRLLVFCASRVCLEAEASKFLAIHELHRLLVVSRRLRSELERVEYVQARECPTGVRIPFPVFPGLFRPGARGLFRHQLASLAAMRRAEAGPYGALRGGVLADAPGLGKTVTVLARVLATAGERPAAPAEFWDAAAVGESWRALGAGGAAVLRPEILRGLRALESYRDRHARGSKPWVQAGAILREAAEISRFDTPDDLARRVRVRASGLDATPADRERVSAEFEHAVALIKAKLDRGARAELLSKHRAGGRKRRLLAERLAKPCGATLVAAPDPLLGHWRNMIERHVDFAQLAPSFGDGRGRGIAFVEGFGDAATWPRVADVVRASDHPRENSDLPATLGSASDTLEYTTYGDASTAAVSPLLELRWLRLVVDEGHDLGSRATSSSSSSSSSRTTVGGGGGKKRTSEEDDAAQLGEAASALLAEIFAERRWIMSGTPTTGDVDDPAATKRHLFQLGNILRWLRHERYGIAKDPRLDAGDAAAASRLACRTRWDSEIAEPFLRGSVSGGEESVAKKQKTTTFEVARHDLVEVLRKLFIRHRKEDLHHLHKPIFKNVELEVDAQISGESDDEYAWRIDQAVGDYVVRRLEEEEKLTVKKNPKMAVFSQHDGDLQSVAEVLIERLGHDRVAEFAVKRVGYQLSARELARFSRGRRLVRMCPVCGGENDAEDRRGCARILMEVELLDDDLVAARRRKLDACDGLGAGPLSASRVLIELERVLRTVSGADGSLYVKDPKTWAVGDELVASLADPAPGLVARPTYEMWLRWGAARCEADAARHHYVAAHWYLGPLVDGHARSTSRCRLCKWGACGKFHGPRWYRGPQLRAAPIQTITESVPLLCLYRDASHGLDLSFLTHIFLLEPLRDSALLEQVVSRAYRVGATNPVLVETIQTFAVSTAPGDRAGDRAPPPPDRQKHYICDYCFKSWTIEALADAHMLTCSRNPANRGKQAARHTIASVFDELKPPLENDDDDDDDDDDLELNNVYD